MSALEEAKENLAIAIHDRLSSPKPIGSADLAVIGVLLLGTDNPAVKRLIEINKHLMPQDTTEI